MLDALAAAFRWWSLPFLLTTVVTLGDTMGALEERSGSAVEVGLFVLVCATWARPTRGMMLAAHLASVALKLSEMPRVWDGTWWFVFTSLPPIVVLITRRVETGAQRHAAAAEVAAALRTMAHVLYAGASVWKLNLDFLSLEYSCAPIFGAQLLSRLPASWGLDTSPPGLWLTRAFPLITVAVEMGVPLLSLAVGPAVAVALGLALHLGIAITPAPNNAGSFSVTAALFYFGLLPVEVAQATAELTTPGSLHPSGRPGLMGLVPRWGVATVVAAAVAYGTGCTTCDAAGFVYCVQIGVLARAIWLRHAPRAAAGEEQAAVARGKEEEAAAVAPVAARSPALVLGLLVSLYYSFGALMLGTWDMGSDHPYSNLRIHSGPSNHLFLATGLLHRAPPFRDAWPPRLPWSGGAVLVEASTSAYFLEQGGVPGEATDLSARDVVILQAAGHRGRQFFSVAKRFSPWSPRNSAEELRPDDFVPFTVPAFELRRLVSEGTLGANATLRYSREPWRPPKQRTSVVVTTDGRGDVATCEVHDAAHKRALLALPGAVKQCAADELALLPPVPAWALAVAPIFNAYPLIDGEEAGEEGAAGRRALICYG